MDLSVSESAKINGYTRRWWKEAVVYQVYPRSFKDSNGDGIGDLNGIISKLDYIKGLGVDVIWLSPHFDSPNADNGYDIRDYRKVMTEFGSMADFDRMLGEIKQRGMKLIVDLVVNHTSDEHAWFVESRKGADNPFSDYYIWRSGKQGKEPNNWVSLFSGSAWKKDPNRDEYYLHLFAEKQPDLNWDNPAVRNEVYDLMKFWLDKGIDGFRMDVIPLISKDPTFSDYGPRYNGRPESVYSAGPALHDYLQEMHRKVLSHYDVMTVGEGFGITLEKTPLFVDERRHELDMVFHFELARLDRDGWRWKPWTLQEFKSVVAKFNRGLDRHCWQSPYLSNHDSPRPVSHFGDDSPRYREKSAKLLATFLLTSVGTPFLYQGDEIGMTNCPLNSIDDLDDIEARNLWKSEVETGSVTPDEFLFHLRKTSRDHSRTPMQWDASANAGFTDAAKPWFRVNPRYQEINAEADLNSKESIYFYCSRLIEFRKKNRAFIYGDYTDVDPDHPKIFAYLRDLENDRFLVVMNFSGDEVVYWLPEGLNTESMVFTNGTELRENEDSLRMVAWDARIYRLAK